MKGRVYLDAKIKKMRERLAKHREKIGEMEAQAAEMERDIKKAEEEQLGYLARSAANTLSGGMEEVFELLRGLRNNPNMAGAAVNNGNSVIAALSHSNTNSNETKEDETVDDVDETDETEDS
jgi:TolA-binding protein